MKITIIVSVYKEIKSIERYLEQLKKQRSKMFEVIFVVDTNVEGVLEKIDEYKGKIPGDVRVVFNSKRVGRANANKSGVRVAKGDYIIFGSVTDIFDEFMVKSSLEDLRKNKEVDIFEYLPSVSAPIKIKGSHRLKRNKVVDLTEDSNPFAYSFAFEFNKIIKTSVLQEVVKMQDLKVKVNSKYSVELVLKSLLLSEKYLQVERILFTTKRNLTNTFNPLKLTREWEEIVKIHDFADKSPELMYNLFWTSHFVLAAFTATTKNKTLIKKYQDKFNKVFTSDFVSNNPYMLLKAPEVEFMKKQNTRLSPRLYKEI